jgi:hypothetical protein
LVQQILRGQEDGEQAGLFDTRREAFATAVSRGEKEKPAQVRGSSGKTVGFWSTEGSVWRKSVIRRKRGRLETRKISVAVGKIIMANLPADARPPRVHTPSK